MYCKTHETLKLVGKVFVKFKWFSRIFHSFFAMSAMHYIWTSIINSTVLRPAATAVNITELSQYYSFAAHHRTFKSRTIEGHIENGCPQLSWSPCQNISSVPTTKVIYLLAALAHILDTYSDVWMFCYIFLVVNPKSKINDMPAIVLMKKKITSICKYKCFRVGKKTCSRNFILG